VRRTWSFSLRRHQITPKVARARASGDRSNRRNFTTFSGS
jgi:hypothetical protein